MTPAGLLHLRGRLATQRRALLDRLLTDAAGTDGIVEPAFLRLLADIHASIAAVDAALAEFTATGDPP